ncbi:hypothetical protein H9P43_001269 [Blastocladiella emersonii ATCC 22665]|nr:hypothetical protein H9P43_001269 [Blastocladiella emersonii ATCC 22665]
MLSPSASAPAAAPTTAVAPPNPAAEQLRTLRCQMRAILDGYHSDTLASNFLDQAKSESTIAVLLNTIQRCPALITDSKDACFLLTLPVLQLLALPVTAPIHPALREDASAVTDTPADLHLTIHQPNHASCLRENLAALLGRDIDPVIAQFPWLARIFHPADELLPPSFDVDRAMRQLAELAPEHDAVPAQLEDLIDALLAHVENGGVLDHAAWTRVVIRHWREHADLVFDLLVLGFESSRSKDSTAPFVFAPHSNASESETCTLQVSTPLAQPLLDDSPPLALFQLVAPALCEARVLQNQLPVVAYLLRSGEDVRDRIAAVARAVPHLDSGASLFVACTFLASLRESFGFDTTAVADVLAAMPAKAETPLPTLALAATDRPLVVECLNRLRVAPLPDNFVDWVRANLPLDGRPAVPVLPSLAQFCRKFTMANLSVLGVILPAGTDDRRRALHPHWRTLCEGLDQHQEHDLVTILLWLAELLAVPPATLTHALRKHLLPVAMRHPPLQRVLEKLEGAQFTKLLVVSIEYVLLWVLLEQPGPWDDPIRALLQSIPGAAPEECISLNLAIELCLHRHTEGLLWAQRVSSKRITVTDFSLATIVHLIDALQHDRWGPSRPCPADALATLDWLVLRAGSEVAVLASQAVSLIANAAVEFPAEAVQCWTSLARVADDKTLARFWPSILLSAARTPAVLEVGPPTTALLDLLFSRATPEVLEDAPDPPAHPVLAPFQARIDAAKSATPSLHDRLARVCARIASPDLVVAEASLDEALALLTQIHASSADAVVRDPHVVVGALVNVAEHHPTLAVRATVCLGQLGAVDLGEFSGAVAVAMRGEAAVSDKDGGLKTGVVAHQEIPVLCAEVLKSCLIPFFRSSASNFAQTIIAYAIQRLLKLHRKTCLDALDDFDRSTVRHLQDSKYRVDEPMLVAEADAAAAVFQPGAVSFSAWACRFCLRLAAHCADSALVAVFRALHPLLAQTQHHQVATVAIPFLVLHLCLVASPALNSVVSEFIHVLQHVAGGDPAAQSAALVIFDVLEYLTAWRRQERAKFAEKRSRRATLSPSVAHIEQFLDRIPAGLLAEAAERVGRAETASYYLEASLHPAAAPADRARLLLDVYCRLGDEGVDYVLGASHLLQHQQQPNGATAETVQDPRHLALQHEVRGDWAAVLAVYNAVPVTSSNSGSVAAPPTRLGAYQAMRELGYFDLLAEQCTGAIATHPEWSTDLAPIQIDACWRLAQWDKLDSVVASSPPAVAAAPSVGTLLSDLAHARASDFDAHLRTVRLDVFRELRLGRVQAAMVRSHYLTDLVAFHGAGLLESSPAAEAATVEANFNAWYQQVKARWDRVPARFSAREELHGVCRSLVMLHQTRSPAPATAAARAALGELWHLSAKLAMADGRQHMAYTYLLRAEPLAGGPETATGLQHERAMAKWLAANQSVQAALDRVRGLALPDVPLQTIHLHPVFGVQLDPRDVTYQRARLHLLAARWMAESGSASSDVIAARFRTACALMPSWDKAYYLAGRYYHQLMKSAADATAADPSGVPNYAAQLASLKPAVQFYARALLVGCNYVHQALPLVLTLWMDLAPVGGPSAASGSGGTEEQRRRAFGHIHQLVVSVVQRAPAYVLMTAVGQVTGRLTHRNDDVFEVLATLLARVIVAFRSPALWQLASSIKSFERVRAKRARDVLDRARQLAAADGADVSGLETLITQTTQIAEQLIGVCNHTAAKEQTVFSLAREFKALVRACPFDTVVMPTAAQLECEIPAKAGPAERARIGTGSTAGVAGYTGGHVADYDPYARDGSGDRVMVYGFVDQVEMMSSMVRPKKVTFLGSNGREYLYLCKPKDDLRKDARLMEFTGLINRLLGRSRAARDRHLYMRRYGVTPLNEECGVIEWVDHTAATRSILREWYKTRYHQDLFNRDIQTLFGESDRDRLAANFKSLLGTFPPVLQEWFVDEFPTPAAWFRARRGFTHTCAVVSMLGYVVGLGDRHLENILLDVKSGDVVHVDFNCLFDKGKAFARPEVVPFRLTQNMVAGFGVVGVEGPFRRACEVVMRVVRDHREALMIVLDTFVHDPLIEWKQKRKANSTATAEAADEQMRRQARRVLADIDARLQGMVGAGLPLGVNGQVDELIRQATAVENLSRMYVGWMPYL